MRRALNITRKTVVAQNVEVAATFWERLIGLIEQGRGADAERHWRSHMAVVGRVMLRGDEAAVVDLMHHR